MKIWVVEMWDQERKQWDPTVGIGYTRSEGRGEKSEWEKHNPDDRFRLSEYRSTRKEKA